MKKRLPNKLFRHKNLLFKMKHMYILYSLRPKHLYIIYIKDIDIMEMVQFCPILSKQRNMGGALIEGPPTHVLKARIGGSGCIPRHPNTC